MMYAPIVISDEELYRHIRWQVLVDERRGVWATLPAEFTPSFEFYVKEVVFGPLRFENRPSLEYRVFPRPIETNLVTHRVRQMQRVVVVTPTA